MQKTTTTTKKNQQQECIPVGCVPYVRNSGRRRRGVWPEAVSDQGGGVYPSMHWGRHPLPLWTEWLTDICKNITFPQLRLRTVKNMEMRHYQEYWLSPSQNTSMPIKAHWFPLFTSSVTTSTRLQQTIIFFRKEHFWLASMLKRFGYNEYRL